MTLRKIDPEELQEILQLHKLWMDDDPLGKRADLQDADLEGANLRDAWLPGANLQGAYLRDTDLSGVNLQGANLRGAWLSETDLRGAKLNQSIPNSCWIKGSKWLRSDVPWWLGHRHQEWIILCDR